MAQNGHFSLFSDEGDNEWCENLKATSQKSLTRKEKLKILKVINRLKKAGELDHKRLVISELSEEDKALFIHAFTNHITGSIIDNEVQFH